GDRAAADRRLAGITDSAQLLAHGPALGVGATEGIIEVEDPGKDARGDHGRREARALFVGPDHDLDRGIRLMAVVVEGADDLQPGEHGIGAVALAAGRLAVEMAAGPDRRARFVLAGPAGEDVAHRVDGDGAARLPARADEESARLPVQVGEGEPADAALR